MSAGRQTVIERRLAGAKCWLPRRSFWPSSPLACCSLVRLRPRSHRARLRAVRAACGPFVLPHNELIPPTMLHAVQAEHDTRGFSGIPSPDEAVAEQVRKQNLQTGVFARGEHLYAQGTRSHRRLLDGNESATYV